MISHTYHVKVNLSRKAAAKTRYAVNFHTAYTHDTYYFQANSWSEVISYLLWDDPEYFNSLEKMVEDSAIKLLKSLKPKQMCSDKTICLIAELFDNVFQTISASNQPCIIFKNNCYNAITFKPEQTTQKIKATTCKRKKKAKTRQ